MSLKPPAPPVARLLEAGGVFLATQFGVYGDGETDDAEAVQDALDYVQEGGGGTLFFPDATYKIDSALTYQGSNLRLEFGPEVVFDFSDAGAATFLTISGSEADAVSLSANCSEGATSVSVAAGAEAGFAAGDTVRVQSDEYYAGDTSGAAGVDQRIGELTIVDSTSSGSVTFKYPLQGGAYNTADSATISKVTMVENVSIGACTIVGDATSAMVAVQVDRARHVRIKDLTLEGFPRMGITVQDTIDCIVDGISAVSGETSNTTAYGVQFAYACEDCTLSNSYFRDYRHGTTCSGSTTVGRGGINRRITITNNKMVDCRSSGVDCHSGVEQFVVTGNTLYGCTHGIGVRCAKATVIGNHIWKTSVGYGISLTNQSTKPTLYTVTGNVLEGIEGASAIFYRTQDLPATTSQDSRGVTIANNVIYNHTGADAAIRVVGNSANGAIVRFSITGNVMDTITGYAIELDRVDKATVTGNMGSALTAGGLKITTSGDAITVTGNTFEAASAGSGNGVNGTALTNCTISGNGLLDWANGVTISNASTNCTITSNNTTGCTTPVSLGSGKGHLAQDNGGIASTASANTFSPGAGTIVRVTGNTTINHIKIPAPGRKVTLSFASNPTVTHNASTPPADCAAVKLAGAANFVASADDSLTIFYNSVTGFWEEAGRAVI